MDKPKLLNKIISQLEQNLDVLIQSAHDAKAAATHEDSRAENKYDTRGLEASYLAGAQAKRAGELQITIDILSKLELQEFSNKDKVDLTALVKTKLNGEDDRWFFIIPKAGGEKIEFEGIMIHTLTPHSPLGKLLVGKSKGDSLELMLKESSNDYEITSLS